MIKIKEAVIVEGKYDKIKLSSLIDALIIETDGFHVFKDGEKVKFIRSLADERGLIILTDSDSGGFLIRNYISSGIPKEKIKHIYIPDIYGTEKRKKAPSKEGKLGVEGIDAEILTALFEKAGVSVDISENTDPVTNYDLYSLGFSGTEQAAKRKKKLLKAMGLPELLSTNSLLKYINSSMTKEEFFKICESLKD